MKCKIYSIRLIPEYKERAIDWFASKWGIARKEYENSFDDCLRKNEPLPQWYIMLEESGRIIGGCGLIENDFVDRVDLRPYLCALFVEPSARGNAFGAALLDCARRGGARLGFDRLYLCTNHTDYYERYGWRHIGTGRHPGGGTSRIYEADTIHDVRLESMSSFFASRADGYDDHMLNEVEGCREGYRKMARLIPEGCRTLLDLGCGTGLELDEILKVMPDVQITGIDLTQAMLDKLREKHPGRQMTLLCGDYFDVDFGTGYDCAISFQTMHHFSHEAKSRLYRKIYDSLKPDGAYIECDYMVEKQEEEDFRYAENDRLRREQNIPENEFCHYDTPCTVENQTRMLSMAGFGRVETVFRRGNTAMLSAGKAGPAA